MRWVARVAALMWAVFAVGASGMWLLPAHSIGWYLGLVLMSAPAIAVLLLIWDIHVALRLRQ